MLKINSMYVEEDMITIIHRVREELNIFTDVIEGRENISVTCPFHKGGKERRPSMGVSTEHNDGVEVGQTHCFTCGYTNSFSGLLEDVMGVGIGEGDLWLQQHFSLAILTKKKLPLLERKRRKEEQQFLCEEFLKCYDDYHPYLDKRGITMSTARLYMLKYSKTSSSILFPNRDEQGRIKYVCERSVEGKHFHLPKGVDKGIYGLYEALQKSNKREILIVESAFNAITATQFGRPAIALLGTGSRDQFEILNELPFVKFVLALDPDDAGEKGEQKIINYFKGKKLLSKLVIPEGKDINDLSYVEFMELEEFEIT